MVSDREIFTWPSLITIRQVALDGPEVPALVLIRREAGKNLPESKSFPSLFPQARFESGCPSVAFKQDQPGLAADGVELQRSRRIDSEFNRLVQSLVGQPVSNSRMNFG